MTTDDSPHESPLIPEADQVGAADVYRIRPIPVRVGDRWSLTGRYLEVVWSEILGPTATLLARRLGDLVELRPTGGELSLTVMGASLGVPPSKVRSALVRLGMHRITSMSVQQATVGVSGLAPSVGPDRVARLSTVGVHEHRWQLEAAASGPSPLPPGRSRAVGATAGCPSRGGSGRSL